MVIVTFTNLSCLGYTMLQLPYFFVNLAQIKSSTKLYVVLRHTL